MPPVRRIAIAAALALAASAATAFGAELLGADPAALVPSGPPGLLGPISERGRNGWDCTPEKAAVARDASHAELPDR